MATDSKPKQIVDAIKARLLSIAAGATYWYTPDKVAVVPFTEACLDATLATAYVIEVEECEHELESTHEMRARMPITIVALRRFTVPESPYNPDPSVADRQTEQSRLEQDFMNRFTSTPADLTLDGLIDEFADSPAPPITVTKRAEETFVEGWACVMFRYVAQFSYMRGQA